MLLPLLLLSQLGAPRFAEPIFDRPAKVALSPLTDHWLLVPPQDLDSATIGTLVSPDGWIRVQRRLPVRTKDLMAAELGWIMDSSGYPIGNVDGVERTRFRGQPAEEGIVRLRRDDADRDPAFALSLFCAVGEQRVVASTGALPSLEDARRLLEEGLRGLRAMEIPDGRPAGGAEDWRAEGPGWRADALGLEDALSGLIVSDTAGTSPRFSRAEDSPGGAGLIRIVRDSCTVARVDAPELDPEGRVRSWHDRDGRPLVAVSRHCGAIQWEDRTIEVGVWSRPGAGARRQLVRAVLSRGTGCWTVADFDVRRHVSDREALDIAKRFLRLCSPLPRKEARALLARTTSPPAHGASRRWAHGTFMDPPSGMSWSAPAKTLWQPRHVTAWGFREGALRFSAWHVPSGASLDLWVLDDRSEWTWEEVVRRALSTALGESAAGISIPEPRLLKVKGDANARVYVLRETPRPGAFLVLGVSRAGGKLYASTSIGEERDRRDLQKVLMRAARGLRVEASAIGVNTVVDAEGVHDTEAGCRFTLPPGNWSIADDFVRTETLESQAIWRDADTGAVVIWKAIHVGYADDFLPLRSAVAHATLLGQLDGDITRSSAQMVGDLVADVAVGTVGDRHGAVVTFRRGRTQFALSTAGAVEPVDVKGLISRIRLSD